MAIFPLGRTTVSFRGKEFSVRELSAGEREQAKKLTAEKDVPFLHQVVFHQTDWPEDCKPASVYALADEPFEFIETLAGAIFSLSGIMEGGEEKKAD